MKHKKNILVTGGAGYIGSQVCKELYKKNFYPITYDNLSTGKKSSVKWGPFIKGDIRDKKKLIFVLNKYKPYVVMHLAALSSVEESEYFPKKYYSVNYKGSLILAKVMNLTNIKNLIFSSSSSIFGRSKKYEVNNKTKKNL